MVAPGLLGIRPGAVIFFFNFADRSRTSVTHEKRLSLFHPYNGNEKEIEIVIHPLIMRPDQTAHRAASGGIVNHFCFGRNTGNQKHGILWASILTSINEFHGAIIG
jgi:hypothetical protein